MSRIGMIATLLDTEKDLLGLHGKRSFVVAHDNGRFVGGHSNDPEMNKPRWFAHRFTFTAAPVVAAPDEAGPIVQKNRLREAAIEKIRAAALRLGAPWNSGRKRIALDAYEAGFFDGSNAVGSKLAATRIAALEGGAARASDPATSKEAAATVRAGKLKDLVIASLRDEGPGTAEDVSKRIGRKLNSVSPRMAGLVRAGIIHIIGGEAGRSIYSYDPK